MSVHSELIELFWDDFDIGPEHGCLAQAFRGQILCSYACSAVLLETDAQCVHLPLACSEVTKYSLAFLQSLQPLSNESVLCRDFKKSENMFRVGKRIWMYRG